MPALIRKKSGSKVLWYVVENNFVDGKNKRETLEALGAMTKSEAQMALAKYRLKIKSAQQGSIMFDDVVNEFSEQYRPKEATYKNWKWHIDVWKSFFGKTRFSHIGFDQIESYKNARILAGWSNRSVNISLSEFKKVAKYALNKGYIYSMPVINRLSEARINIVERLTPDQVKLALSEANDKQRFYMLMMLNTGMRPQEFQALRWNDINFKDGYIHILSSNKLKAGRKIPLTETVRALLSGPRPLSENVCPYQTGWGATRMMKTLGDKVQIKINPYMLRKTFASMMVEAGVDVFNLAKIMGHKTIETTYKYYTDIEHKALVSSMNLNPISGIISGTNCDTIGDNTVAKSAF